MKRTRLFSALAAVILALSVVSAPTAANAAQTWSKTTSFSCGAKIGGVKQFVPIKVTFATTGATTLKFDNKVVGYFSNGHIGTFVTGRDKLSSITLTTTNGRITQYPVLQCAVK